MRIGAPVRYYLNSVALTRRQEGWGSAVGTGARLLSEELRKRSVHARLSKTNPELLASAARRASAGAPDVDPAVVEELLAGAGSPATRVSLDPVAYARHRQAFRYPRFYAGGPAAKGGAREWKILEYFASIELLDIRPGDVVIDVASERSVFPDLLEEQYRAQVYRQDLVYPPGVNGGRIGGSAAAMPVPESFADILTLHNSFEHFEGSADTDFVREAWRVLRPGGAVCVVPLYLAERYSILTDPLVDTVGVEWDDGAEVVSVAGHRNRFGRFYSPAALVERVLRPADECGFERRLCRFENIRVLNPTSGLHFGLVLVKPPVRPA
jgi:SAM-dependent methyltransferase